MFTPTSNHLGQVLSSHKATFNLQHYKTRHSQIQVYHRKLSLKTQVKRCLVHNLLRGVFLLYGKLTSDTSQCQVGTSLSDKWNKFSTHAFDIHVQTAVTRHNTSQTPTPFPFRSPFSLPHYYTNKKEWTYNMFPVHFPTNIQQTVI